MPQITHAFSSEEVCSNTCRVQPLGGCLAGVCGATWPSVHYPYCGGGVMFFIEDDVPVRTPSLGSVHGAPECSREYSRRPLLFKTISDKLPPIPLCVVVRMRTNARLSEISFVGSGGGLVTGKTHR